MFKNIKKIAQINWLRKLFNKVNTLSVDDNGNFILVSWQGDWNNSNQQ